MEWIQSVFSYALTQLKCMERPPVLQDGARWPASPPPEKARAQRPVHVESEIRLSLSCMKLRKSSPSFPKSIPISATAKMFLKKGGRRVKSLAVVMINPAPCLDAALKICKISSEAYL